MRESRPAAGAAAVIFDAVGRVLLIKENDGRRRWGLPGGAIEDGETPEDAAVRETREETGVAVVVEYLIGVYQLDNGFTAYAFRCSIIDGAPSMPTTGEIAKVEWKAAEALPVPRSNILHYAVPDALAGRRDLLREGLPRLT